MKSRRATAAPNQLFAPDAEITASDPTNADKLTGEGFTAAPTSAWTTGQNIWVGTYPFFWNGTAWTAGTAGGGTPAADLAVWRHKVRAAWPSVAITSLDVDTSA